MNIREVMTPNPRCVSPGDSIQNAARIMRDCDTGADPLSITAGLSASSPTATRRWRRSNTSLGRREGARLPVKLEPREQDQREHDEHDDDDGDGRTPWALEERAF
jgi:CBS domain-containing protein